MVKNELSVLAEPHFSMLAKINTAKIIFAILSADEKKELQALCQ